MRWLGASMSILVLCSGCAGVRTADPQQRVYVEEGALTTAIQVATQYANLPRCSTVSKGMLCSNPVIVAEMNTAAQAAAVAIQNAETAVTNPATPAPELTILLSDMDAAVGALTRMAGSVKTS